MAPTITDQPERRTEKAPRNSLPPMPPTRWVPSTLFPQVRPSGSRINHFGISGGKDSTALLLWALFESGYPRESLDVTWCDTGNEASAVHEYISYLEERLRIGVTRIYPGLDFYELSKRKGRFPAAKARFCTYYLKVKPTIDYINATFRAGHTMTLHSGVRADESADRSKLLEREYDGQFLCEIVRPLLPLSINDVWRMHEKYGIKPNPLYAAGMSRVGCFPCIMSRKSEVAKIAERFPDRVDIIRQKELESSEWKNGFSSFFRAKGVPSRFHSRAYTNAKGIRFTVPTIDDVIAWSGTERGAKLDPRLNAELGLEYDTLPTTENIETASGCQSGFCE